VPRSALPDVLERIAAIGRRHRLRLTNVFHAGDGNLHPLILFNDNDPEEVRRAEDFGVALRALELGLELPDQAAYDAFYRSLHQGWLEAYHATFYEVRDRLRTADSARWLTLNDGYPPFTAFLKRAADRFAIAILTARDRASLDVLLDHLGVAAIIPRHLRLDKEAGLHKTSHLSQLADRLQVTFPEITFVDDKVNHLERVAPLGVRPVLAGWGLNTPREHARAMALGFPVARLDALDSVLLGG